MSKASFWQRGDSLDYFNDTTSVIEANTIMPLGTRLGVIGTDIQPGEMGAVLVSSVYEMPKDDSEVGMGETVYYDEDAEIITTAEKDVIAGFAAQAAAASDGTILVKING